MTDTKKKIVLLGYINYDEKTGEKTKVVYDQPKIVDASEIIEDGEDCFND